MVRDSPADVDVLLVAGARPNFVKIAPLHRAIAQQSQLRQLLLHTGQHHDFEMSQVFFDELEIPAPDVHLGANSGTHARQTASIMVAFEEFLGKTRPRMLVVVGDVNSTLACSVVAAKAGVPIAHVEAGLRSFDRSMPEEINRIVTDSLSHLLYTTCDDGTNNLLREGVPQECIHQLGNVMIDTLARYKKRAEALPPELPAAFSGQPYALATIHRPSNVDEAEALERVVTIVEDTARQIAVVFPVHPRTRRNLDTLGMNGRLESAGVYVRPPLGYLKFLRLMLGASVVLTDSGGIQEETSVLGVPCLTLRRNTERPVTVTHGTNRLVGLDRERVREGIERVLQGQWSRGSIPPGWDGHAAERIARHLANELG